MSINEDGRKIGRIPGVGEGKSLPFRPEEEVLRADILDHGRRGKTARFLKGAHDFSSRSAIEHMDRQYEGVDPDEMLSGATHEQVIFQASDLNGTIEA